MVPNTSRMHKVRSGFMRRLAGRDERTSPLEAAGRLGDAAAPPSSVGALLANHRSRIPNRPALVDLDRGSTITFDQLARLVDSIGSRLIAAGAEKGDRILLLSPRGIEGILLWLGIWRIGAVVCPFDADTDGRTGAYLRRFATAVRPKFLLYPGGQDTSLLAEFAALPQIAYPSYRETDCQFFLCGGAPAYDVFDPTDTASILCTSGTTGEPKFVIHDHLSYWRNGHFTTEFLGLTGQDRLVDYRSLSWNSTQILSLMPFLQTGLTLHVARRFSRRNFFRWIEDHGSTVAVGLPTVVNILMTDPQAQRASEIGTLRLMTSSTAPLAPRQWQAFEERYSIPLLQLYGTSETGWICGNRHCNRRVGTVGWPADPKAFRILDPFGRECPAGVEGEVSVTGLQCAAGLLEQDGRIRPLRGAWINTGDLAVRASDGSVTINGRCKDVIIRSGQNISLLEIDNVLLAHPEIGQASAIGVPHAVLGEEVICYVVAKRGAALSEDDIIDHCRSMLPDWKCPKQVHFLADLPRSDRGKVLRRILLDRWKRVAQE